MPSLPGGNEPEDERRRREAFESLDSLWANATDEELFDLGFRIWDKDPNRRWTHWLFPWGMCCAIPVGYPTIDINGELYFFDPTRSYENRNNLLDCGWVRGDYDAFRRHVITNISLNLQWE